VVSGICKVDTGNEIASWVWLAMTFSVTLSIEFIIYKTDPKGCGVNVIRGFFLLDKYRFFVLINKIFMIDYHVHPYYSLDAEGTVEEYCVRAIEIGMEELCFTPHFDIDPERREIDDKVRLGDKIVTMKSNWIERYVEDVELARKRYSLEIKIGIEVGYDSNIENELRNVLKTYPFDFVLGAIHNIDHISISDKKECGQYFENKSPEEVCGSYFTLMENTIKSGLFDVIAHFDIYKKYGWEYYGEGLAKSQKPYLRPILTLVAENGLGIEVNTSGLRKPVNEIYPAEDILELAKKLGVKIVTIGSDAHKVEDLGKGLKKAEELIEKTGFEIYRYRGRKPYR